jgi:hypothetical protein
VSADLQDIHVDDVEGGAGLVADQKRAGMGKIASAQDAESPFSTEQALGRADDHRVGKTGDDGMLALVGDTRRKVDSLCRPAQFISQTESRAIELEAELRYPHTILTPGEEATSGAASA